MSLYNQKTLSYTINSNSKLVSVVSDFYVPFEPKRTNKEIREKVICLLNDIKSSIKNLVVEEDELLLASYSESDKYRFYDVENMLFYNIGTSTFSNCCKTQLAFIGDEQRFSQDKTPIRNNDNKHSYFYKIVKANETKDLIDKKEIVAYWKDVDVNLEIPQSAMRYYSAIRESATKINIKSSLDKNFQLFGMKIDVTMPNKNLPASIMKPMLDGLICAFHGEEGNAQNTLNLMFGNHTGQKYGCNDNLNIFGKRQYVDVYRGVNSYKWNPEDERLQFAWITVNKGEKAKISGKIYKW